MSTRCSVLIVSLAALIICAGTAPAQSGGAYQVVRGWPVLPEGFSFGHVPGLDVDAHNHVWLFHRGTLNPVMALDGKTGEVVRHFGEGMFVRPHGLRVDPEGFVWVTDKDDNLIYKFTHEGKVVQTLGTKGVAGQDGTHFSGVADLIFQPNGDFYVADGYVNSRVAKFSKSGKFLFEWGRKGTGPGEFDCPHSVALDPKGLVYVADRGNARVQIFDPKGKYLREWKSPELGRPWAVGMGYDGYMYVVDGGDAYIKQSRTDPNPTCLDRGRVLKVDLNGKIAAQIGSYGRYDGQFIWPHNVALGKDGAVYVSEVHTGMRVQKFVKK